MIDKLEAGVKYKLVDKEGYINKHTQNREFVEEFLTTDGCFQIEYVGEYGNGMIGDDVVIWKAKGEYRFFDKFEETNTHTEMEYRVIRKYSKHQVCGWRKGVKLYEDEFGTLVRNDKRTKFYTDTIEWRELVKPAAPTAIVDLVSQLGTLSKPELQDLLIRLLDVATATINDKGVSNG